MALPLPPLRDALVGKDGHMTEVWQRWLREFLIALEAAL